MIQVALPSNPLLDAAAFVTEFTRPLGDIVVPAAVLRQLARAPGEGSNLPPPPDDGVRAAVRDLLRHGGFKPTGRSKPASEYLLRAVGEGALGSINLAVDACNVASLHSGLPISVVDLDRARPPFSIAIAPAAATYLFNASGQTIDIAGLLCLCDADGPCANAVKDAQRTKTQAATRRTLSIVWGTHALPGRTAQTVAWYRDLLSEAGASTSDVRLNPLDAEQT